MPVGVAMEKLPAPTWESAAAASSGRTTRKNPIAWSDGKIVTNEKRAILKFLQRKRERGETLTETQVAMLRLSRKRSSSTGDVALTKTGGGNCVDGVAVVVEANVTHVDGVIGCNGGARKRKRAAGKQSQKQRRRHQRQQQQQQQQEDARGRQGGRQGVRQGGRQVRGRGEGRGRGKGRDRGPWIEARLSGSARAKNMKKKKKKKKQIGGKPGKGKKVSGSISSDAPIERRIDGALSAGR